MQGMFEGFLYEYENLGERGNFIFVDDAPCFYVSCF